ncbi:hypothetical protein GCM10025857_42770 [Alicyclobacillus contaminans]|nr:hypothetical protein GCM10025857_42770 [Alicyclobacillus contaminans]
MGFVLGVLNPHVVEIGSVVIHWYGVIIAAGILAALQLSTKEAKKRTGRGYHYRYGLMGNSDWTPRRSALLCVI